MPGILLAIGYVALLLYLMRHIPFYATVPGLPVRWVGMLFLLKIAAGTALWAIYTWVYTERVHADVFKYFDDSAVMFSALPDRPGDYLRMLFGFRNDSPWFTETYYVEMNNWFREYESNLYNDAHTLIRFNAFARLFSFGQYHVHTVFASFLALTGMIGIYRSFAHLLTGRERALMAALFLVPTVLFWASAPIKESLLFFGLGLMLFQAYRLLEGRIRPMGFVVLVFTVLLLFVLKFYVLLSMIPALLALAWSRGKTGAWWRYTLVYGAFIVLGLNSGHLIHGFDILEIIALKQKDFIGLAEGTGAGSFVMPPARLEPTLPSFLASAPHALLVSIAGPLLYPSGGVFGLISAAENALLLLVIVVCLLYHRPWRQLDAPLLLHLLAYGFVLSLVIGWTTPVMGALVRYRAPLLPFLLVAALLLLDQQRLLARWPRLKPLIAA